MNSFISLRQVNEIDNNDSVEEELIKTEKKISDIIYDEFLNAYSLNHDKQYPHIIED